MKRIILFLFIVIVGMACNRTTDNSASGTNNASTIAPEKKLTEIKDKKDAQPIPDTPDTKKDIIEKKPKEDKKATKFKKNTRQKNDKIKANKRGTTKKEVILPNLETSTKAFSKDYLMGKFKPNQHPDFTKIAAIHASRKGMHLRKDAYAAFVSMYNAAKKDGVTLKIISATRPFHHQKRIWEAKWTGKRAVNGKRLPAKVDNAKERALLILHYSSMPGTSRHHWGTDIDLNDLNNRYFERGVGQRIYKWMSANASKYGFCQVYSPKGDNRPWGYEEEKWHWSYLPVAKRLTELYKTTMNNTDISGFKGSETAISIDMINKYVLGINPDCK